jgi:hypothetical protein
MRFRTPELFLGCFLTIAVFSIGILFSSRYHVQTTQNSTTEKTQQAAAERGEPKAFWETATTDPVAAFTLCLVFVGGLQAYLFLKQLVIIRISLDEAKLAGLAATRGAKATEDAVELSRQTAERQLRAYVQIVGKDFLVQGDSGNERFVNQLSVVNTGQTPAYQLKIDSVVKILPRSLPEDFTFAFIPEGLNRSMMMVGSGRSVGHDSLADTILSEAEMISIMRADSGVRLYSFGTVKYEDCFGKPRFTNFCYFLEWVITTDGYSFSVHPTEQHNDAN